MGSSTQTARAQVSSSVTEIRKTDSWVTKHGIERGEWLIAAKPQLEFLMRPTNQLKARVYAAGLLHSAGYQDEKAWKQVRVAGELKTVPYTPKDIAADLNEATEKYFKEAGVALTVEARKVARVERQDVRRALASLEAGGAVERRLKDGTPIRDLPIATRKQLNNSVQLFFFCRPKAASGKQAKHLLEQWETPPEGCRQKPEKVPTYGSLESISFAFKVYNNLKCDYLLEKLAADPNVVDMDYLRSQLEVVVEDYKKDRQVVDEDYRKRLEVVTESAHIERIGRERIEEKATAPKPADSGTPDATAALSSAAPQKEPQKPEPPAPTFDPKPTWEVFWHTYTGHAHGKDAKKGAARMWWSEKVRSAEYAQEILEGLNRHIASADWIDGIGIPYAINFLSEHRYHEHPKAAKKKPDKARMSASDEARERIRRREANQGD